MIIHPKNNTIQVTSLIDMVSNKILRCNMCGQEISGSYYRDLYNRNFCSCHTVRTCYCCSRLCTPEKSIKIEPYGYFCPECQKRKVDKSSIIRIARFVNEYYRRHNFIIPEYALKMISESKMVIEAGADNVLGLAFNSKPYEIHIIRHLSRTGFVAILAHEVLHLWQYDHNFKTPNLMCEGMCELGSYLLLSAINKREANIFLKGIEDRPDKVYGGGFRLLHSIYSKYGWKGVVQALLLRNGRL